MGWDFQFIRPVPVQRVRLLDRENRDPTSGPAGQVEVGDVTERKLVNMNP
jgi:hypothetical protein